MAKKVKYTILLLSLYLLIFWIGFKSGGSYSRMKSFEGEKIAPPPPPKVETFYVVNRYDYGTYKSVTFEKTYRNDVLIEMLMNEKLRPLLKLRDIEIYDESGKKIY